MLERLEQYITRFPQFNVLVVGDIYLDENVSGQVTRVSREAPISVYEVQHRRYNPGAAGNVACNFAALGAKTALLGLVGDDINGGILMKALAAAQIDTSGIVTQDNYVTNTYGKLRAGGPHIPSQEILRTDTPSPGWIPAEIEDAIIREVHTRAPQLDAIVVVDQESSVCTPRVREAIAECGRERGILTLADSRENIGGFAGYDVIVPNELEAELGSGMNIIDQASLRLAGQALLRKVERAFVTRGPNGITIFQRGREPVDVPIVAREVLDVCGAGDTVTVNVALTLLAGGTVEEAAAMGNAAASVTVMKPGAVTVSPQALVHALRQGMSPQKVVALDELQNRIEELQAAGKQVVWTNGCFDILHVGHVTYLLKAAREGDVLIVGLNSDDSVRTVKGPSRPINNQDERALVLSALECVDYVTIFSEPTTVGLLERLKPDVYAKGGDYTIDTINQDERRLVESYGGRITLIPGIEGQSTSALIERILREQDA